MSHRTGVIHKETEAIKKTEWTFQSQRCHGSTSSPEGHKQQVCSGRGQTHEPEQVDGDAGS